MKKSKKALCMTAIMALNIFMTCFANVMQTRGEERLKTDVINVSAKTDLERLRENNLEESEQTEESEEESDVIEETEEEILEETETAVEETLEETKEMETTEAEILKESINAKETKEKSTEEFVIENGILIKYNGTGGEITIPEDVTSIDSNAFSDCKDLISGITIDGEIEEIGSAFREMDYLEYVVLPETLKVIGAYAFYNCVSLKNVNIPHSVQKIENNAFYLCKSLEYIELPNSITALEDRTFSNCDSLKDVNIPNTIKEIKFATFSGCDSLISIEIPDSVQQIGASAFAHCELLENVHFSQNLEYIAESAFYECPSLKSVELPDSLLKINDFAFEGCNSLQNLTIPVSVHTIGNSAFSDCSSIKNITFLGPIKNINPGVFSGCSALEDIAIPDSIEKICDSLFVRCTSLKSITIPSNVKEIGASVFWGCNALEDITIPDSVEKIGNNTFSDCTSLKSIIIPSAIKKIGWQTFNNCSSLREIYIMNKTVEIDAAAFDNIENNRLTIYGYSDSTAEAFAEEHGFKFKSISESGDERFLTKKLKNYDTDNKIASFSDNSRYYVSSKIESYITEHIGQWLRIKVEIKDEKETIIYANVIEPNLRSEISVEVPGKIIYTKNGFSFDGECFESASDFEIPFKIILKNEFRANNMTQEEFKKDPSLNIILSNFDFTVSDGFNFSWWGAGKPSVQKEIVLKVGDVYEMEGFVKPELFYSLNGAEKDYTVTCKFSNNQETHYLNGTFTVTAPSFAQDVNKDIGVAVKKTAQTNIIGANPTLTGMLDNKQEKQLNQALSIWISTITNPDIDDSVKRKLFKSYKDNWLGTIESTCEIPINIKTGKRKYGERTFLFTIKITNFNYELLWGKLGLELGDLGNISSIEWEILEKDGIQAGDQDGLLNVITSANVGELNGAVAEAVKSVQEEVLKNGLSDATGRLIKFIEDYSGKSSVYTEYICTLVSNTILCILGYEDHLIAGGSVIGLTNDSWKKYAEIKCPVDVYLYKNGVLHTSVVNNMVHEFLPETSLGSVVFVEGDTKIIDFVDESYDIKLVGNALGTMDYIIYEEVENKTRTIKFDNLPLQNGLEYTGNISAEVNEDKSSYNLNQGTKIIVPDYDTMEGDEILDLPSGNVTDTGKENDDSNSGSDGNSSGIPNSSMNIGDIITDVNNVMGDGKHHWIQDENGWWLHLADGSYPRGEEIIDQYQNMHIKYKWVKVNGKWFAFGPDGYAEFGWLKDYGYNDNWFYVDINDGMKTGWQLIEEKWYYLNPVSDGKMGILFTDCITPDGYSVNQNGEWDQKSKN